MTRRIEQTALREVAEETGLEVRILAPVGADRVLVRRRTATRIHKTVHYFLMEPIGGDLTRHDHEFDEVRWVPLDEARGAHELRHRARDRRARTARGRRCAARSTTRPTARRDRATGCADTPLVERHARWARG